MAPAEEGPPGTENRLPQMQGVNHLSDSAGLEALPLRASALQPCAFYRASQSTSFDTAI